ncbi:4Fe-4S ferredoxin, partial [Eggerthella lenta]
MRQAPSAPYASLISHSRLQEKSAATAREVARTIYEG